MSGLLKLPNNMPIESYIMSIPSFPPNRMRRRVIAKLVNGIKVEATMNEVEFLASETQAATPIFSHSPNSPFAKPRKLAEVPNNGLQDILFASRSHLALPSLFQTNYFDEIVNTKSEPQAESAEIPNNGLQDILFGSRSHLNLPRPFQTNYVNEIAITKSKPEPESAEIPNNGLQDILFASKSHLDLPRPFQTNYFDEITSTKSAPEPEPEPEPELESEIERRSRNVFFVEKILKKRVVLGEAQYYVKWMGYNKNFNSWEPRRSFVHDVLVENYELKIRNKRNPKRLKNKGMGRPTRSTSSLRRF